MPSMTMAQVMGVATVIRTEYDKAHDFALEMDTVVDGVFALQQVATDLADYFAGIWPSFDKQAFLAAAIDQPGVKEAWVHEYPCDDLLCRECHAVDHAKAGPFDEPVTPPFPDTPVNEHVGAPWEAS